MPVEDAIPHLAGIDMYGNSIPVGTVGGDLFEYINWKIGQVRMVQFPPLGLEIPEDHPHENKYFSISLRKRQANSSDVAENHTDESRRHSLPLYRRSLRCHRRRGTIGSLPAAV
jgi:hypothetical protein